MDDQQRRKLAETFIDSAEQQGAQVYMSGGTWKIEVGIDERKDHISKALDAALNAADGMGTIPEPVYRTLLRALTYCGNAVTNDEQSKAWAWVEDRAGNVEDMGS